MSYLFLLRILVFNLLKLLFPWNYCLKNQTSFIPIVWIYFYLSRLLKSVFEIHNIFVTKQSGISYRSLNKEAIYFLEIEKPNRLTVRNYWTVQFINNVHTAITATESGHTIFCGSSELFLFTTVLSARTAIRSGHVISFCTHGNWGLFVNNIRLFLFNSADTCGRTVKLCEQWWAVVTAFSFVNSDNKISGKHDKVKKNFKLVVASGQNSGGLVVTHLTGL